MPIDDYFVKNKNELIFSCDGETYIVYCDVSVNDEKIEIYLKNDTPKNYGTWERYSGAYYGIPDPVPDGSGYIDWLPEDPNRYSMNVPSGEERFYEFPPPNPEDYTAIIIGSCCDPCDSYYFNFYFSREYLEKNVKDIKEAINSKEDFEILNGLTQGNHAYEEIHALRCVKYAKIIDL